MYVCMYAQLILLPAGVNNPSIESINLRELIKSISSGQGRHSLPKDATSLPNRGFRWRGLNDNFDVSYFSDGKTRGKSDESGTNARPSHRICTDPTLNGHIDAPA